MARNSCKVRITFDRPMRLSSLTDVTQYGIDDATEPQLMGAIPQSASVIRIFFNAAITDSALTLSNYAFTCPGALTLTPSSIVRVTDRTFDMTVIEEMRTGTSNYTLRASNIFDLYGNRLDTEHSTYTFNGFGIDPQVVSATYINSTTIDVLFDKDVDSATAEDEANYVVDGQSTPLISTAVLQGDNRTVRLSLGTVLTTGTYTITVSNVTDLVGSVVDSAHDTGTISPVGLAKLPFANHKTLVNDLIAYYKMDGSPDDYFTNALNGAFPAGTPDTVTGKIGTGYYLSPRDDYALEDSITLPDSAILDNLSYCTISAWVYIPSFSSIYYHTVCGRYGQFALGTTVEGYLYTQAYTSHGLIEKASSVAIPTGGWHHVVGLWNGRYLQGYLDGVRILSQAMYADDHPLYYGFAARVWRLGCAHNPPSISNDIHSPLMGYCDEVGIWNRALTRSEVEDLYNSNAGLSVDVIQPQVSSAAFVSSNSFDVTYDKYVDETLAEDAGNYTITGASSPTIDTVTLDSDFVTAHVILDTDMITGDYTVEVEHVTDLAGNVIDPAHDSDTFSAVIGPFNSHPTLSASLVAYYKLDGNADDSHTNTINGALIGAPPIVAGKINTCPTFNQVGEAWPSKYMDIPSHAAFDAMTKISLSAWINISELGVAWAHIIACRDESWQITVGGTTDDQDRKLHFKVVTAGGTFQNVTSRVITAGAWAHVAFTYDGSNMKYYLNGALLQDDPAAGGNLAHGVAEIVRLSSHPDDYNTFYGLIDEFGIWDKALSLAEVQALYNSGSGLSY